MLRYSSLWRVCAIGWLLLMKAHIIHISTISRYDPLFSPFPLLQPISHQQFFYLHHLMKHSQKCNKKPLSFNFYLLNNMISLSSMTWKSTWCLLKWLPFQNERISFILRSCFVKEWAFHYVLPKPRSKTFSFYLQYCYLCTQINDWILQCQVLSKVFFPTWQIKFFDCCILFQHFQKCLCSLISDFIPYQTLKINIINILDTCSSNTEDQSIEVTCLPWAFHRLGEHLGSQSHFLFPNCDMQRSSQLNLLETVITNHSNQVLSWLYSPSLLNSSFLNPQHRLCFLFSKNRVHDCQFGCLFIFLFNFSPFNPNAVIVLLFFNISQSVAVSEAPIPFPALFFNSRESKNSQHFYCISFTS